MNNWLPAVGAILISGLVTLLAWWLRRHDSLAVQMRESIGLIDDLRRDVMDLEDWAWKTRTRWRKLQESLVDTGAIKRVEELAPIPESRVSKRRHDHYEPS